jgi:hypothetical protein
LSADFTQQSVIGQKGAKLNRISNPALSSTRPKENNAPDIQYFNPGGLTRFDPRFQSSLSTVALAKVEVQRRQI